MFELSFYAGLGLTVLLLLVGHWFPWPRPLPLLWKYTYGTCSIVAGVAVWLLVSGQCAIMLGVTLITLAGGIAVIAAYQIDHVVWLMRMGWKADQMADRMLDDGDAE